MNPAVKMVAGNVIVLHPRRPEIVRQAEVDAMVRAMRDEMSASIGAANAALARHRATCKGEAIRAQPRTQYVGADMAALGICLLVLAGLAAHILAVSPG